MNYKVTHIMRLLDELADEIQHSDGDVLKGVRREISYRKDDRPAHREIGIAVKKVIKSMRL